MGLSKAQKALVSQFQAVSGSSSSSAQNYLQAAGWNVDIAFNEYLDDGGDCSFNPPSSVDQAKIARLFDDYKDKQSKDVMLAEGIEAFCRDLQVDPADIVVLVISFYFEAENSGEYQRKEFLSGMTRLDCDSISRLESRLPALRKEMQDARKFQTHHKMAISKDTWVQLLDFVSDIKPDMSNFDDNAGTSAWPYLIDDFVNYVRSRKGDSSEEDVILIN